MTSAFSTDLIELLKIVCSADDAHRLASELGEPAAPAEHGYSLRIAPTRWASFSALQVRPWTGEDFGEVDVELSAAAPLPSTEGEMQLGELRTVPRLHGAPYRLQAIFEASDRPAWAAVYFELSGPRDSDGSMVTHLSIRTEPQDALR